MIDHDDFIIIKKYPNRRLYNTKTSDYITLSDVRGLVLQGIDFIVRDAKTSADITRSTLAQIIFEQENNDHYLLSVDFLRQMIVFYEDKLVNILPAYLELAMKNFTKNQHNLREFSTKFGSAFNSIYSLSSVEKIADANMKIFEQSIKLLFNIHQ